MNFFRKSDTKTIKEIKKREAEFEKLHRMCMNGIEYENKGNINSAIEQYEKCVFYKFSGSHPYKRLCIIYRKQKRYADEIRVIKSFLNVYPKQQSPNVNTMIWFNERLKKSQKLNSV